MLRRRVGSQFAVFVAAAVLAGPAVAGSGGELAPERVCPTGATAEAQVKTMRCLVNWARRRHGLRPLRRSVLLERSAALRADEIRRCGDFSHTPCGDSFASVFARVGYFRGRVWVGENLAWATVGAASPRATIAGWLASPEHRHNLLTRGWRDGGVALLQADALFGQPRVVVWVSQFGRRS
jgi:uncharacterized protein YkwD